MPPGLDALTHSPAKMWGSRVLRQAAARFRHPAAEESIPVRIATLFAVLVAVAAVAVQEEFTRQAIASAGAIAVGFWASYHLRHRPRWWLKTAVAALILLVARDFFGSLISNPYDPRVPLIRLFLWLQVLHSFDLPARKDLKYSLASAVVLMAVGAVYARETAFGALLVPFILAASTSVVAMRDAPPVLRMRTLGGMGVRLAAAVLVAAALVFAAVPQSQGLRVRWLPTSPQLWISAKLYTRIVNPAYPDSPGADPEAAPPVFNPQGYVGFSTHVDLRLRGVLDRTLVMRVRSTRPAFWRGLGFDRYTGRGWTMSDGAVEEFASDQPRIVPRLGPDEPWPAGSEQVIQTFYVEADQPNVLFAAYRPFEVYVPTGSIGVDAYAGLRSPAVLERGTIYSVISRVPAPAPALLGRARGVIPETVRRRYLVLPPLPERVSQLAGALTTGLDSPYAKAAAIGRYLQDGFTYTLQAPLLPQGADAVDEFLFVSRQGSCELFASAMAVLLRASGVPARLVTGYVSGTYNIFTGYYEVRNSDAHAWVEVYQPGVGWIEYEATPGFTSPGDVAARPAGQWLARDAAAWVGGVLARGLRALAAFGSPAAPTGAWPIAAAALLGGMLLLRHVRPARRAPAGALVGPRFYEAMLRLLARRGLARPAGATPREFAAALPLPVRAPASAITDAFEQHRYGRRTVTSDQEARCQAALADLRRGLKEVRRSDLLSSRAKRSDLQQTTQGTASAFQASQ